MTKDISTRQQEIIEASGKILMDKGIKGLTTKNLALEMNFSESAIYRHFSNKEDIIILLFKALAANIELRMDEILMINIPATAKLEAMFTSHWVYFTKNPHFIVAILSEDLFFETNKIQTEMMQIIAIKTRVIIQILEEGKAQNEFRKDVETQDLLQVIMGCFRNQMLQWRFSGFTFDLQTAGSTMSQTIIKLIKTQD